MSYDAFVIGFSSDPFLNHLALQLAERRGSAVTISDGRRRERLEIRSTLSDGVAGPMSEPRIGRVLIASLHQGIAETLPDRLEFYENWLSVEGLREGTIGLAPLHAVLSFLRAEGNAYDQATARAGRYAAEWTVNGLPGLERRLLMLLPLGLRTRGALRTVRTLVRSTYPGSRAIVQVRNGQYAVDLRGSLFCEVRERSESPLCGYYAAAIDRVLEIFAVPAETRVVECRSSGSKRGCTMTVALGAAGGAVPAEEVQAGG